MATATLPSPPRATANPAPARPAHSVRRTSSIDVSWPDGEDGDRLFIGRVRDYLTPTAGQPGRELGAAEFQARITADKTISAITAPTLPGVEQLVGMRGGNHLRLFLKEKMPELISGGAPIYLVLDDISGTALVSAFAVSHWHGDFGQRMRAKLAPGELEKFIAARINVCWGLQEGNSGVDPLAPARNVATANAGDVRNPADPDGWHELPVSDGPGFRRARRIDVTRDPSGLLRIDAAFQDSVKNQDGGRGGIHEYNIAVTADPDTLEILTLEPEARILPYSECPGAVHNTKRLIGSRIGDIREEVLGLLRGPDGCTHLNDALRSLAEVPKLAGYLAES